MYGTSAITAVTAQNTMGVTAWETISPALVTAQMDALFADLPPAAVKTGMLGTVEVVNAVIAALRQQRPDQLVVDPVMIATSRDALLDESALALVRDSLVPLASLVTPNLDEARALLGDAITSEREMGEAARALVTRTGARAALVKGGHLAGTDSVDLLFDGELRAFRRPRIHTTSTHGTGCTLSAAITAQLALGLSLQESVRIAGDYVHAAIASAPGIGRGHGPLDHTVSVPDHNARTRARTSA